LKNTFHYIFLIKIKIPYHVRSEAAFPMFHSTNILKGKWGGMGTPLVQNIEVYYNERHVSPTYSINDETRLYIARVYFEGIGYDESEEDVETIYMKDVILSRLQTRLDRTLNVPPGTVRMNLVAI
jgi:hypothetical protein